jgi:glyoxylase-like metal-dependent hydrolase (beta-lactamase superfamily II)
VLVAGFPAGALAANCYVLAPGDGASCVVVDPGQDATVRLDAVLAEHRLTPVAVLLTHGHLDHVAGARAVCDARGIPALMHPADEYMLDDPMAALSPELRAGVNALLQPGDDLSALRPAQVVPLAPGELELAGLRIVVLHIPGHTGGSVAYRIPGDGDDADGTAGRPELLLTGDTLFAGSIGRTDLPGGSSPQILQSIAGELLTRPDDAVVLPGHGPASTIGAERASNPFLTGLG